MTAEERRNYILDALEKAVDSISANTFAKELDVSRQIIVGDVALLRALGHNIEATPRGYLLSEQAKPAGCTTIIHSHHKKSQMLEELYTIVDNGGSVLDVQIEHPYYGTLIGTLNIYSRYDVEQFAARMKEESGILLSGLTDGTHSHTIRCNDEEIMTRVLSALREKAIID